MNQKKNKYKNIYFQIQLTPLLVQTCNFAKVLIFLFKGHSIKKFHKLFTNFESEKFTNLSNYFCLLQIFQCQYSNFLKNIQISQQQIIKAITTEQKLLQMDNFNNLLQIKYKPKQSPIVSKQFFTPNFKLHYDNYHYLKQLDDQSLNSNIITINNVLCQKIGDNFKKITQIRIGKKVIILEDHYKFEENGSIVQKQFNKQIESDIDMDILSSQIVFKPHSQSQISDLDVKHRKDKKNIVKNIVKCYISWLKQQIAKHPDSILYIQSLKALDQYINKTKFNNQLIVSIVNHPRLNTSFYNFLRIDAINRINNSKIVDKKSHIESVEIYLKACIDQKTDSFKIIKRNKNQSKQ